MTRYLFNVFCVALLTACASQDTSQTSIYTADEYRNMTLCIGMADTAMFVASHKLKGTPIEQMNDHYRPHDNARLNLATVEKVYADSFTSEWDYTLSFFNECALNLADVPASRVRMAGYCMQNGMISDMAYAFKQSGASKQDAHSYFAAFKTDTVNTIVDKVYSSSQNRAEMKLDVWNSCMAPITASK